MMDDPALSRLSRDSMARVRRAWTRTGMFLPILIGVIGIGTTGVAWWRAREAAQAQQSSLMSSLAKSHRGRVYEIVRRDLWDFRALADMWRILGVPEQGKWAFEIELFLATHPSVVSVGWVDSMGTLNRFASRDTTLVSLSTEQLTLAATHLRRPTPEAARTDTTSQELTYLLAVRTPADSLGVAVATLSPRALFTQLGASASPLVSFRVRTASGSEVFHSATAAPGVPPWLRRSMEFTTILGSDWTIEYEPTREFMASVASQWPSFLLLTGFLLSLASFAIGFQMLRLHDYSRALRESNEELGVQLASLSTRDQALRQLNDDLELRVEQRTGELREAVIELEAFTHSISHDLRSPIGAIQNLAAVIEEDYRERLDPEGHRLLLRIRTAGDSATRLLDRLTQFAWIGGRQVSRVRLDMTQIARESFAVVSSGPVVSGPVRFELAELPPAMGDPELLESIFENLFSNAIKFTRDQPTPTVVVRAERGETENTYVVSDNGIGFDPDAADSLFEPFRKLHSTKEYQGSGLGLAIVAKSVRRLSGRIWAESNGAGGAKFYFVLPGAPEHS
ncbi:MAG: hypothetical protein HOP12_03230 [Candidatus Eisenbacteria bacterium]|uniref:histidine kinase n=1 Tax=Eiseniibacteriota bacterium TaxID=2212470 RepID=A0A849SCS6_UNCEI|nr:hypothetical protein [Candidatus Eisenbacteria bacterium]